MVMEVILLERIESLGQMGEVVKVRPGYARNFLLPQKKALRATKDNLAYFETQRTQLEAQNLKRRQDAQAVSTKLEGLQVVILRQAGETGQLYGSVATRDIADAVTAAGFTIDRRQVLLDQPIKTLGIFNTRVALHPEVIVGISVNIAQSQEEAQMQAEGKQPRQSAAAGETAAAPDAAAAAPVADAAPAETAPAADTPAAPKAKGAKAKKAKTEE
jgi:large subunit ribosomal protein L9